MKPKTILQWQKATFLRNHLQVSWAMDLFSVFTLP